MKNSIYYVNEEQFEKAYADWKERQDTYSVVLDGKELSTWDQFYKAMIKEFKLPMDESGPVDSYLDWMRDLEWLESEAYVLAVVNYDMLLCEEMELKNDLISDFADYILPYWEKHVIKNCVGGYPKPFNVYFVSDK
ncbi:MAG: hypothetical protein Q4F83_03060 [Eubacteriales bacterium]|nr:hypothetical protein [Eubacteriales bacterium]